MQYPSEYQYLKLISLIRNIKEHLLNRNISLYCEIANITLDLNINDKDSVIEIENKVLNKLIEYNLQNFVREYRLNLLNF